MRRQVCRTFSNEEKFALNFSRSSFLKIFVLFYLACALCLPASSSVQCVWRLELEVEVRHQHNNAWVTRRTLL